MMLCWRGNHLRTSSNFSFHIRSDKAMTFYFSNGKSYSGAPCFNVNSKGHTLIKVYGNVCAFWLFSLHCSSPSQPHPSITFATIKSPVSYVTQTQICADPLKRGSINLSVCKCAPEPCCCSSVLRIINKRITHNTCLSSLLHVPAIRWPIWHVTCDVLYYCS